MPAPTLTWPADAAEQTAFINSINSYLAEVENRVTATEKVTRIKKETETVPGLLTYTGGNFTYSGSTYTFNRGAKQVPGFGFIDFNQVAADPDGNSALLDHLIAQNDPALVTV